jgi:mannose/fructose/N-acetylgalactosamine-specific phosphotransferase system component IIC
MDFHGVKLDFVGLAAVIMAIATLYSKVKSNSKKKEEKDGSKTDSKD